MEGFEAEGEETWWSGRTAEVVHDIVNQQFGLGRGGLPGNDDSGGLSSWYVWASLGLFPAAGLGLFLIHPPSFESATMRVARGELHITTEGFVEPTAGGKPQYVQSATWNWVDQPDSWLSARDVHEGGRLHIVLGPEPSDWGTATRPPA